MIDNFNKVLQHRFGLIGESPAMKEAIDMLLQASPTDLTILITGDTGTGKEVFANAVHSLSNRKKFPFVSVNCGAIPETLLESELFGHEKGAFTGAQDQRKGFFEVANKGTIFLDEIGEMPYSTQVKLLRILESGEFSRLGSSVVHKVDVRVIAATNRNLEEEVRDGNFRQDLYFRLKNVFIYLPELRKHPDDIPLLIEYFSRNVCEKIGLKFDGSSPDAIEILKHQAWPGNIRELKNLVETMITLEKASYLTPEIVRKYVKPSLPPHVDFPVMDTSSLVRIPKQDQTGNGQFELGLIFRSILALQNEISDVKTMLRHTMSDIEQIKFSKNEIQYQKVEQVKTDEDYFENLENLKLEDIEKKLITEALRRYHNNRRQAANALGVSERTLYRKISDLEIIEKNIN
jgi:DNA-binding NtrC family response regulator